MLRRQFLKDLVALPALVLSAKSILKKESLPFLDEKQVKVKHSESGQLWAVNSRGGYYYSENLSRELRTQLKPGLKFRKFADAKDVTTKELGKGKILNWDVYSAV